MPALSADIPAIASPAVRIVPLLDELNEASKVARVVLIVSAWMDHPGIIVVAIPTLESGQVEACRECSLEILSGGLWRERKRALQAVAVDEKHSSRHIVSSRPPRPTFSLELSEEKAADRGGLWRATLRCGDGYAGVLALDTDGLPYPRAVVRVVHEHVAVEVQHELRERGIDCPQILMYG